MLVATHHNIEKKMKKKVTIQCVATTAPQNLLYLHKNVCSPMWTFFGFGKKKISTGGRVVEKNVLFAQFGTVSAFVHLKFHIYIFVKTQYKNDFDVIVHDNPVL